MTTAVRAPRSRLTMAPVAAALLGGLLLTGCGAEDQVNRAASDAASSAAAGVSDALTTELRERACTAAADGEVSAQEATVLESLVAGTEGGVLPAEVQQALREAARAGDRLPGEVVAQLRGQVC